MNLSSKRGAFPLFSLLTGTVGFAFRCWLLSATDDRGLLPENHFAGIACFILLALTLIVSFLQLKTAAPSQAYRQLFPPSVFAAIGCGVGALGMGISAFTLDSSGLLRILLPVLGIAGAGCLMFAAYYRFLGQRPNCLLYGAAVVFLILRTLACCRMWGSEPAVQAYFFHLLASLFVLMACYYRAEVSALLGDYRRYTFFAQAALFCCCVCLPGKDWLFYLSAAIWMAADFCVFPVPASDE